MPILIGAHGDLLGRFQQILGMPVDVVTRHLVGDGTPICLVCSDFVVGSGGCSWAYGCGAYAAGMQPSFCSGGEG